MAVLRLEPKRRRVHAVEELWFGLLERVGARGLRRGLIACGVSPQVASGLVFWIDDQRTLAPHSVTDHTRARYRRLLEGLDQAQVEARAIPG